MLSVHWLRRYRRALLLSRLRELGYELDEVLELLEDDLGRGVTPQTPDTGTQLPRPALPSRGVGLDTVPLN